MLQESSVVRAAAIPAVAFVVFGAIILLAIDRTPVEAVPAPRLAQSAAVAAIDPSALSASQSVLPDDDDDIVDYTFVYPETATHVAVTAHRPRVVNVP